MKPEKQQQLLYQLEGLHTLETVAETLGISKQAALNLLTKLKKEQHVTVMGGGRRKRLYKITMRKQLPRVPGMFDIINKYSPHFQVMPWYDHQVHGKYGSEEALIDALQTQSFRLILASMRLFNHITNWPKLYRLAKEKDCWQKVGALYDVARLFFKVRKMPEAYQKEKHWKKMFFFDKLDKTKEEFFKTIEKKWNLPIPFRIGDLQKVEL